MSSLSINGIGQGLSQLFGGFSPTAAASQTTPAGNASGASGASSAAPARAASSATQAALPQTGGHHRRHGGISKQFQQIQDAVTSALRSVQSGGGTTDANKVIEDAIAKVFKQQAGSGSSSGSSANTQQADSETDATGATDTDSTSPQQAFFKTLQSLGVSPRQFRNDFLSAIQDAQQTGNIDVSTALKALPKGTTLDAIG